MIEAYPDARSRHGARSSISFVDGPDAHAIPGLTDADLDALRSEALAALDG